ncbi:protein FAM71E2 [Sarcophilus harrisii]|uniref:Golgi associated RAB2 interactor family member 5B n=1 Tax=Sarcophilus harrisii TaxID=9305 RepID=A0A7N4NTR2_SARHA|nr:protein FAM71E2 [Sarcophilus harrisii]
MGVASSLPGRLLPDLILLARPVGDQKHQGLELTRLLPTDLARLSVHHVASRRLKLRLASGRSFYLQLDAGPREGCFLFNRWRYLVYLLRRPRPAWGPQAHKDQALGQGCKLKNKTKMSQAAKAKMMSRAVGDSIPFMTQLESPGWKGEEKNSFYKHPTMDSSGTQVGEEGQSTITIWTLFSIISSILSRPKASKASTPMTSNSGHSSAEPCVVPHQTSSSWLGSRQPFKKIFYSSNSFNEYLYSSSQSQKDFRMAWKNEHPQRRANGLSKALPSNHVQHSQHGVPSKTPLTTESQRKRSSKLHLEQTVASTEPEEAAELNHEWLTQQEDKSLMASKKSSPRPTSSESAKMPHVSTKTSLYPYPETSPNHLIKASEPSPSHSPKTPQPFPSPPQPSSFTKVLQPSPSAKVPPEQSTKVSPPQVTRSLPKQSKKPSFHPTTKTSPDQFTKDSNAHPRKASTGQAGRSHSGHSLKSTAVSFTLYSPDSTSHSKEASPHPFTKVSPKHSKKSSFHLFGKASPQNSRKSSFHLFGKASPKHSKKSSFHMFTKASPKHSKKSSFHLFPKVSPKHSKKSSFHMFTKASLKHSKKSSFHLFPKVSPKHSKKSSFYMFTKASPKHSKKSSSFHPTTKVSPDQFTKDSNAHPQKASTGQVDRSPPSHSLKSTAVSLTLYSPDSPSHSKKTSSYPPSKILSDQSKKISKAPSNKASPRALS